MYRLTVIALLSIVSYCSSAQTTDSWQSLSMVTFTSEFDADWGIDVQVPTFGPIVKALEGKQMEVEGFIIPLTGKVEQSHFMLSRYPQSMCFFCGAAGPETAMQVFMAEEVKVAYTDEKITVRGTLHINDKDANNPLYTLSDATVIK